MYAPQGPPAVYSSVLSSSVIIIAAVPGLLPPFGIPALGLRLHVPELIVNAVFGFQLFSVPHPDGVHHKVIVIGPCVEVGCHQHLIVVTPKPPWQKVLGAIF